ncbi:hypothetical protein H6762_04980 [Candidatus Nomurabacteria bacterium]|nr:hypothetical protein [Candidatus Nomurabacteria bacterium]
MTKKILHQYFFEEIVNIDLILHNDDPRNILLKPCICTIDAPTIIKMGSRDTDFEPY